LFAGFGSGVELVTVAMSFTSTWLLEVMSTVIVVRPPAFSRPRLHVTIPPAIPQLPLAAGDVETKLAEVMVKLPLLAWVSITTTLRASEGPRLSTMIVQVAVLPVGAGPLSGLHTLVIRRSALSSTTVVRETVLLPRNRSGSFADTVAVLVIVVGPPVAVRPAETSTLIWKETEAPLAKFPRLQVSVPGGAWTQASVSVTYVTPAGSVSTTVTPVAAFGPLFLTVTV
jgi:hypothetical protein